MKTLAVLSIAFVGAVLCAHAAPPAGTTVVPPTRPGKPVNVRPTVTPEPASNPGSGTISPGTPTVNWTGTATSTGGMGPVDPTATGGTVATGQEGVTQDTFMLTLGGAVSDYQGKSIQVTISWTLPHPITISTSSSAMPTAPTGPPWVVRPPARQAPRSR